MRFKNGNKIKRDTQLIIISVAILTLATLRVSYSAFFSIQSQTNVQTVSTGTLVVTIDNNNSRAMSSEEDLMPTATNLLPTAANSSVAGDYAILTLNNSGTLPADFSVTLGYDAVPQDKASIPLLDFRYLLVGIYEEGSGWVNLGSEQSPVYYTAVTGLTPTDGNTYPILRSNIDAKNGENDTTKQYRIYIWLSEETPVTEIGKLVYLKLEVKSTPSTPVNGQS